MEILSTKVTRINNKFHVRLLENPNKVVGELVCKNRLDIGFCCHYLLRWYDKLGGESKMAINSRRRHKCSMPVGKVWYNGKFPLK